MERLKGYQKSLILAVILAVAAFLWILYREYLGVNSYWVALVIFAVYVAQGSSPKKLPLMLLGGVLGVIFGVVTYALAMLFLPTFAVIGSAIAGGVLILVAALVSVPRMNDMLPMTVVGWGCFMGAMLYYNDLISTKPVWAIPKLMSTLFGVLLSVVIGLLLGALIATPLLGKTAAAAAPE